MFAALALALLATTDPAPAAVAALPVKLAAPGLAGSDLDPGKAQFLNDYFAEQVIARSQKRISIVTESQVAQMLGLERQKQLLGCADDESSCLAEIAGALGVDALVLGNVARFGTQYAVMVRVISAQEGSTLWSASARGLREEQLVDWMANSAVGLVAALSPASGPPATAGVTGVQPSAAGRDDNSIWLGPLSLEYGRRLRGGSSWAGARLTLIAPAYASQLTVFNAVHGIARYHPLPAGAKWNYAIVGGAGFGIGAYLEDDTAVGFSFLLGVEGGYQSLRLGLEVCSIGWQLFIVPRLSLAFTF